MTQLPRIGDKVRPANCMHCEPWTVLGQVDDYNRPMLFLIEAAWGSRPTAETRASESWQHWTPATQRNNP